MVLRGLNFAWLVGWLVGWVFFLNQSLLVSFLVVMYLASCEIWQFLQPRVGQCWGHRFGEQGEVQYSNHLFLTLLLSHAFFLTDQERGSSWVTYE